MQVGYHLLAAVSGSEMGVASVAGVVVVAGNVVRPPSRVGGGISSSCDQQWYQKVPPWPSG